MLNPLKAILSALLVILFFQCSAQTDTTGTQTYDIVYLKDGRTLKGNIVVFEEEDGDIIFKSLDGLTYSLSRKEYTSFKENVQVQRDDYKFVLKPRKENEFEFSLGFSASILNIRTEFEPDDYYREQGNGGDALVAFRLGAGKYFNRQHYFGAAIDLVILSDSKDAFSGFFRYCNHYRSSKKNTALYLPVEIGYNRFNINTNFGTVTTVIDSQGYTYNYYGNENIETSFSSMVFNFGQGLSFAMNDKKSIAFELSVFKNFFVRHKFIDLDRSAPKADFGIDGLKLMIAYNI
jgi:hypothetical protein